MSLYPEPLQALLDDIKRLNAGADLKADEYNFGNPVVIQETANGINSTMLIESAGTSSPYAGQVTVSYRRLKLEDLLILVPDTLRANGITTTLKFAEAFNVVYGTNFTADDIVDTPVVLTSGSGTVTLVAKTTSRGWVGSVTFNVGPGPLPLEEYLLVTKLNGLNYPDPYKAKPFGNAYSYWRDYSEQFDRLDVLHAGEGGDLVNVRDALIAITTDPWVTVGKARYSLQGAVITYVGPTSGYPEMNQNYEKGVCVELSDDCLTLSGRMFLHYNAPINI